MHMRDMLNSESNNQPENLCTQVLMPDYLLGWGRTKINIAFSQVAIRDCHHRK